MAENWALVETTVPLAKSIAWDGCHKIYVLLDDEQTALMDSYGYRDGGSEMVLAGEVPDLLKVLRDWYERSCGLRFISAVSTNHDDPNAGFTRLIKQFEDDDDENEDEEPLPATG